MKCLWITALALALAPLGGAQEKPLLAVGEPLPRLTLPVIGGEEVLSLDALKGKKTLLLVYASW